MECVEHGCLDLADTAGQPDACCSAGSYAACSHGTTITVCYTANMSVDPLILTSSFLPCAALCIAQLNWELGGRAQQLLPHQQEQTVLAAATPSGVLLWILKEAYAAAADQLPPPAPLRLVGSEQQEGPAEAMAVSSLGGRHGMLLAVGCGSMVVVWGLQQLDVLYRLEGHQGTVTAVAFSPKQQHHLVTAAEDRSFKIWDLHQGQLLYQSSILGAAVPTCLALDATASRLAMGCADGSVRQFDLSKLPSCRELQVMDISKAMQQVATAVISAAAAVEGTQRSGPTTITAAAGAQPPGGQVLRQQLQQLTAASAAAQNNTNTAAFLSTCSSFPELLDVQSGGSGCILAMHFVQLIQPNLTGDDDGGLGAASGGSSLHSQQLLQDLLTPPPQLLVCTRRGLLLVSTGSGDVERCYLFGMEAARAQDILHEAKLSVGARSLPIAQAHTPNSTISQLQQPCVQQQQQQTKALATFKALHCTEQPVAACCFATGPQQQQQQRDPMTAWCCVASGSSSRLAMLQLGPDEIGSHTCISCYGNNSSPEAMKHSGPQQVTVFQTRTLPPNSPMLDRALRHSSTTGGSSSRCIQPGPGAANGSGGGRAAAEAKAEAEANAADCASPHTSSDSARRRATWLAREADACSRPADVIGKLSSPCGKPQTKKAAVCSGSKATLKKSMPSDKAVTFQKQIKSSGYGFVQPKIKLGQAKPPPIKVGASSGATAAQLLARQLAAHRQYPLDAAPPQVWELQPEQQLPVGQPVHNGGILRVAFAGSSLRVVTCEAAFCLQITRSPPAEITERKARCLWLPTAKHSGAGTSFVGHSAPVTGIDWSHSGEYLLTASADRTATLWSCSSASPQISFSSIHQQANSSAGGSSSNGSSGSTKVRSVQRCSSNSSSMSSKASSSKAGAGMRPLNRSSSSNARSSGGLGGVMCSGGIAGQKQGFLSEVTAARFFYMDQFVLLSAGNKLHMYRYKLPEGPANDDIQRLKATGSYSLAGSYSSSCQTISDIAVVNSFASTLVLSACSNRSIELVDAATLQVAGTIAEAHSRPVQRLVQPAASPFVSHPRPMYELFASAAPDGLVKLWDVRSGRCVRSFNGHKHISTQVPIGLAFSPCMRYLATGSEDKAAYVYDLRTCTLLAKLRPPGPKVDLIADVAFHPVRSQLVLGCMNGSLYWYGDTYQHAHTIPARGGVVKEHSDCKHELVL